jgi:hypothetical protein
LFFKRPKIKAKAGIQNTIDKANMVADVTPYSPFCQKNVEVPNSKGAITEHNPIDFVCSASVFVFMICGFANYDYPILI